MDGKGIDPSFTGKYNINVGKIIEGFVKTEQARLLPFLACARSSRRRCLTHGCLATRTVCSSSGWSRRSPMHGAGCAPSRKPRTSSTTNGPRTLVRGSSRGRRRGPAGDGLQAFSRGSATPVGYRRPTQGQNRGGARRAAADGGDGTAARGQLDSYHLGRGALNPAFRQFGNVLTGREGRVDEPCTQTARHDIQALRRAVRGTLPNAPHPLCSC